MSGPARLVVELALGPIDTGMVERTVAFAREFDLTVQGVYVEDEQLHRVAGFARSVEVTFGGVRRRLDQVRLSHELVGHARAAERRLMNALARAGVRGGFEVRRGDARECVAGVCAIGDIVVIDGASDAVREGARESAGTLLVLPPHFGRRDGPIVVVARHADDPAIALGHRFAGPWREVLVMSDHGFAGALALPALNTGELLRALAALRDRLIVIARDVADDIGAAGAEELARAGSVPVLMM